MNPEPTSTINLDQYDHDPIPWAAVTERLEAATTAGKDLFTVLGTVRADDGRPHAAPVGAMWIDGGWYVVTGSDSQKGRNLAHSPACTLSARLDGADVVFTGEARRITNADELEHVAAAYRANGWPAEVAGDEFTAPFFAPSGGPPPWNVYRIACEQAVGVGTTAQHPGASKWAFA